MRHRDHGNGDDRFKGMTREEIARETDRLLEERDSKELVLSQALARDPRVVSTPMGGQPKRT